MGHEGRRQAERADQEAAAGRCRARARTMARSSYTRRRPRRFAVDGATLIFGASHGSRDNARSTVTPTAAAITSREYSSALAGLPQDALVRRLRIASQRAVNAPSAAKAQTDPVGRGAAGLRGADHREPPGLELPVPPRHQRRPLTDAQLPIAQRHRRAPNFAGDAADRRRRARSGADRSRSSRAPSKSPSPASYQRFLSAPGSRPRPRRASTSTS